MLERRGPRGAGGGGLHGGAAVAVQRLAHEEPPDIFAAVRGFYVMYDDDKPNEQIQKWHVEILKASAAPLPGYRPFLASRLSKLLLISRNKRYLDKPAMRRFWEVLEDFALHKKPWLVS
eukprot:tig00021036_g17296.t1